MNTSNKAITHVAIIFCGKVWSLPAPNRHHNVIRMIATKLNITHIDAHHEGFLDSQGNYLTRKHALKVAKDVGQLLNDVDVIGDELYSENLW